MNINLQNAALAVTAGKASQFPRRAIPQVALIGRSNVGKSSLINTLLGRKALARVSSAPGKTITVNFYDVDGKLFLVDLPGYGYARRSAEEQKKWSALTNAYVSEEKPDMIVQLIDLKVGPTKDDYMMIDWLATSGIPYIIVATKADKPNKTDKAANLAALSSHPYLAPPYAPEKIAVIPFSSHTGEGKNELLSVFESVIKK